MTVELGVIEGFFGRPYDWDERAELMRRLAPHGYGFYLYAPKADGYLRRRWREPHPQAEAQALAGFAADCRAAGVRPRAAPDFQPPAFLKSAARR